MNKFKSTFWNSGKLQEYFYFSFDGNEQECNTENFLNAFGGNTQYSLIDFDDYSAKTYKKRMYKGSELELEIENYILNFQSDVDLFILDTPSLLYVFTKNKKLRDKIHASMLTQ